MATDDESYLQQQKIPGWSGAVNNMLRALLAGDAKSANPYFDGKGLNVGSPPPAAPVSSPLSLAPPQVPAMRPMPPQRPFMSPTPGVPYTGQAMGINGPGPMGPLLMQPPVR